MLSKYKVIRNSLIINKSYKGLKHCSPWVLVMFSSSSQRQRMLDSVFHRTSLTYESHQCNLFRYIF